MADDKRPMDLIRAARTRLENPYAYIEDLEVKSESVARSPLHVSENPYATLASWNGDDSDAGFGARDPVTAPAPAEAVSSFQKHLSKADFRSECIRIFLPYVPPHLPRRVPQHQKDFIARNERRPGRARHQLMQALRRYDLSTTPGISPQFNREHSDELSERKLRQIEAQVPDDD